MPSSRSRAVFLLISLALLLAAPVRAQNITCTASMSALAFGNVNPLASLTTANATLNYTCTNSANSQRSATVCFSIGEPAGAQTNPRLMHDGAGDSLQFQLYQNASYSLVWGSTFFGSFVTPLQVPITLAARGTTGARTATMYGQVLNGQTAAIPGSYTDVYMNGDTAVTINEVAGAAPPASCSGTQTGTYFPFTVSAPVGKQCNVTPTTLDFGTVGLLIANTPGTSTIGVQCSSGSAYNVGLDAGLGGGGNINARQMALGANRIAYQLYSNTTRTTVWGNTVGTNTVAGTGNGNVQNLTVYGSVPAQTTPSAGVYTDTVVVTVTY
ncbi:MAG: spore coat protein U domain-containing protein [Casimicrobiaceae bacterium]